ncbi:MAG: hypothetical protein ACYST6_08735 [Planctomycetota bacterium]
MLLIIRTGFVKLVDAEWLFNGGFRVDNEGKDAQIDDDILQSRKDILRAKDIIPPFEQEPAQEPPPQETAEQKHATGESAEPAPQEGKGQAEIAQEKAAEPPEQKTEIPRFDLAEDIMAEQRRMTATRRKAPTENKGPQAQEVQLEPTGRRFEPVTSATPQEQKIIAQIVARDIERLLQGEATGA